MMSIVTTQKRKDVDCAKSSSNEKSKVRLIERSNDGLLDGAGKPQRGRAFNEIRRRSLKIISMLRSTKGASLLPVCRPHLIAI